MAWAPDYILVDDLLEYMQADVVDEDVAGRAVTAASRGVDDHTNRQFGKVAAPELRLYTPRYDRSRGRWVARIDDLQSVAGVVLTLEAVAVTGYTLLPLNATQKGRPWERLVLPDGYAGYGYEGELSMTAAWGWTAVPTVVEQATLLQASRIVTRREAPFGIAEAPDAGSLRLLAKIDADVQVMLKGYQRDRFVVG